MSFDTTNQKITSSKGYLIRALYEWILDNHLTPYILVDVNLPSVHVPVQYVKDGQIVLNISPASTSHLQIANDWCEFKAAFSGNPFKVSFPTLAVLAIYARENGQGMFFGEDIPGGPGDDNYAPITDKPTESEKASKKPALKIIK